MTIQSVATAPKRVHIAGCKAWLKSFVKRFASSAYLSTILPLRQLKASAASAALGVLPAIIGLLLILGTTTAQASQPKDFYDFEFAQKVWKKMSDPEMSAWLDNKCAKGSTYGIWMKSYKSAPQKALQALESHPKAQEIKQCHDVILTFKQWIEIYRGWRIGLQTNQIVTEGWNKNTGGIACLSISMGNIFTHSCNDLPDWRNPDGVKQDAEWLARNNKKRAADDKLRRAARERVQRPGSFGAAREKATRLIRERFRREEQQ